MADKSIKREQTEIDPMFFIPEGVDELVYSDVSEQSQSVDYESDDEYYADYEEDSEESTNYYDGPETPDVLGVVSQTVRTTNDGSQVIDVVILVDDIPGLSKYDYRVTKI